MFGKKNYYEILGVEKNATELEIQEAYNSKTIKTEAVEKAYETLIITKNREEYDKKLEDERVKDYYEILDVEKNASYEQIHEAFNKLPEEKRQTEEMHKIFKTLSNPKKRAKYNYKIGMLALKKEESKKIDRIKSEELTNNYDNYQQQIYINKYKVKIEFLKKQIELSENEKDKERLSYKRRTSRLLTQLEIAEQELEKWQKGREQIIETKTFKIRNTEITVKVRGKGTKRTLVSSVLSNSIKKVEELENQLEQKDISNLNKINLSIKSGFWKLVNSISSGSIKLQASSWSKVQDFVVLRPSLIKPFFEKEEELETRLSRIR